MSSAQSLQVKTPQATCFAGVSRRDITPPAGIYHRMWGAATHDQATGIHRPLLATVLIMSPSNSEPLPEDSVVIAAIDHCLMWDEDLQILRDAVCSRTAIPPATLQIAFSHTHAAGLMDRTRADLPGGELIAPYLDQLADELAAAVTSARSQLQPAAVVYAAGHCSLAAHRDTWDAQRQQFVCGYNPEGPADGTLQLARVTSADGSTLAVVVNYACHPTTLAWDNTLISPDYVGALREKVEAEAGGLCVFLQGASGDLGPREGFLGNPQIADRNGRQLAYAVMATLEGLPQPGTVFCYDGAVVSGATIGVWKHQPAAVADQTTAQIWRQRRWTVRIPYLPGLPTTASTEADLQKWQAAEADALSRGAMIEARDCRAQCERMTRQLVRLRQLPSGDAFPVPLHLHQIGQGYWLWLEGEYYQILQQELRRALHGTPLVVSTVVNGWRPSYLPDRKTFGLNIYQEQIAVLEPGCLETLIDEVRQQLKAWQELSA